MKRACLLLFTLVIAGCTAVGDFCREHADCPGDLICSAQGGKRGVCTYPGGLTDTPPSDSSADASVDDASRE